MIVAPYQWFKSDRQALRATGGFRASKLRSAGIAQKLAVTVQRLAAPAHEHARAPIYSDLRRKGSGSHSRDQGGAGKGEAIRGRKAARTRLDRSFPMLNSRIGRAAARRLSKAGRRR
jgi:hypothetical protein